MCNGEIKCLSESKSVIKNAFRQAFCVQQNRLLRAGKSITLVDVAAVKAALEPLHTLLGRAVGEAVEHCIALAAFLQTVVAY